MTKAQEYIHHTQDSQAGDHKDSTSGSIAQSVACLTTVDSGVESPILSWRLIMKHFYGHYPPSADLFKKGCCQLQAKECPQSTCSSLSRKKVVK